MSKSWIRRHARPLILAGALLSAPGAPAQTTNQWTGNGSTWRNANHWSPQTSSGGPDATSVAVFGTQGTATNITINLNQATDQTQQVGRIDLQDGPDRTISNGNNASGQLQINGVDGQLLVNTSTSGTLTFAESSRRAMDLHLATAGAIEVTHTGARIVIQSSLTGTHGFHKTGHGTLELTASNTITGAVTISGGTVALASSTGGALQHVTSVAVGAGATLQLCASHQLGNHTGLILHGGTFLTGSATAGYAETLGTLTLNANSTIDLGASSTTRLLQFADSSAITWASGAILTITNWQGVAGDPGTAGRLLFGTGGLTSTQLAQIRFAGYDNAGGQLIGPDGELTPIPEAPVSMAAAALLAFIGWRERQRLTRLTRRLFAPAHRNNSRPHRAATARTTPWSGAVPGAGRFVQAPTPPRCPRKPALVEHPIATPSASAKVGTVV